MARNDFHPIPRRKLRDSVLEQLLSAIERGTYPPGAELPSERELMAQMGVGRPAVREAMMALEHSGMIAIAHGRRAQVRLPEMAGTSELAQRIMLGAANILDRDAPTVGQITEARHLFETNMVRLAAERATPSGVARLKRALDDNRRAISSADGYLDTDMALHRTIAAMAGNPLCAAVGDALFTWLPRHCIRMVHVKGANLLSYDEHARIVEAIAARDPKGAVASIEAHLARSHTLYQRLDIDPMAATAPPLAKRRTRGRVP
ncbi:MAG: FCD domain-containing protein [Betaproteobacteria bacterium]